MKKFVIGLHGVTKEGKKQIHNEFLEKFGIDLNSEEYKDGNLADKWKLLLQNCTAGKSRESLSEYIRLFEEKLFDVIDINQSRLKINSDVFVRSSEREREIREQHVENFKRIVKEYTALVDNYNIYEADVWLNAWMAVQYLKAEDKLAKKHCAETGHTMVAAKPKTGYCDIATGFVRNNKGLEMMIPFDYDEDGCFCEQYLKCAVGNKGSLFWSELDNRNGEIVHVNKEVDAEQIRGFKGYQYRAEIKLVMDKDYSRYSCQRIKALENKADFKIEDKIMFHKTINGLLVRNMTNVMIRHGEEFEAEDYIYFIDLLCGCKSLVWQNLIGYLFVLFGEYQKELVTWDIYGDMYVMFYTWLSGIEKINYNLRKLTEGLIYLYDQNTCDDKFFESKCKSYLESLELENEYEKEYWKKVSTNLRVNSDVRSNHKDFKWIYAILQRETINQIKYMYRTNQVVERNMFCFETDDRTKILSYSKISDFEPNVPGAIKKLKEMAGKRKKDQE
jgi:hypothetical protein